MANNLFTQYGFEAVQTMELDGAVTQALEIDDEVLDYDSEKLLGEVAAPKQKEVFEIEAEPSPDMMAGNGQSTGGGESNLPGMGGKCLGEDLHMRIFKEPLFVFDIDGSTPILEAEEVRQGFLNNCPLPATLAAMAHVPWAQAVLTSMITIKFIKVISHRVPQSFESCPSGAPPAKPETFIAKQLLTVKFRRELKPSALAPNRPPFLNKLINGSSVSVTRALYYEIILGDELFYASSVNGVLWPSLIEKAYAVALGNNGYEGLERYVYPHLLKAFDDGLLNQLPTGLDPLDVMKDVADVGSKVREINKSLTDAGLIKILKKHNRRPTIVSTKEVLPEESGFTAMHAYAVIDYNKKTKRITLFNAAGGVTIPDIKLSVLRANFNNIFYTTREE